MTSSHNKRVFLADDDMDDCLLFEDAIREINSNINLTIANDGIELMNILDEKVPPPPDVIFLDLNMPRKNGLECLKEIKRIPKLKDIPVVVFSTNSQQQAIDQVYEGGARHYICKPGSYPKLRSVIEKVISKDWSDTDAQPPKDKFLLSI